MAVSHNNASSACCRSNSRNLDDSLSNLAQNDSLNISEVCSAEEAQAQEQITSKKDEILEFINNTERAIAATSSEEVRRKLSRDSTAHLFARIESTLHLCQSKFPDCPKDKPIKRQTRSGGRTANDKLAADIIALIKYYTSGELTIEFNEIFKKSTASSSDKVQEILKSLGYDEAKQFIRFAEDLEVKLCQLREDFEQTRADLMTDVSNLKQHLCEKQAKIESLESEMATLKGNYKTDTENTRNKLESIDTELIGQSENISELKQSTHKICKKIDSLKKHANLNIDDAERSLRNIQKQSKASNQNLGNSSPIAINIESEESETSINASSNTSETSYAAAVGQKANHSIESSTENSSQENNVHG